MQNKILKCLALTILTTCFSLGYAQPISKKSETPTIAKLKQSANKSNIILEKGEKKMRAKDFKYAKAAFEAVVKLCDEAGSETKNMPREIRRYRDQLTRNKYTAAEYLKTSQWDNLIQKQEKEVAAEWENPSYDLVRKSTEKAQGKSISWDVVITDLRAYWAGMEDCPWCIWALAAETELPKNNALIQIDRSTLNPESQKYTYSKDTKIQIKGKIIKVVANVVVLSAISIEKHDE